MSKWKRPENIDQHPLRYAPVRNEIERIITRRVFEKRIDGYVLEMSLEIADAVDEWHPIETAPKDGSHILAASSAGFRYIVLWDEDRCYWVRQDNETPCFPHNWRPLPVPPRRESVYSDKVT